MFIFSVYTRKKMMITSSHQNRDQRKEILQLVLESEPIDPDVELFNIAKITEGFSGSDLHELCRSASVYRMRDFMRSTTR